jgi:hypothetical protein
MQDCNEAMDLMVEIVDSACSNTSAEDWAARLDTIHSGVLVMYRCNALFCDNIAKLCAVLFSFVLWGMRDIVNSVKELENTAPGWRCVTT